MRKLIGTTSEERTLTQGTPLPILHYASPVSAKCRSRKPRAGIGKFSPGFRLSLLDVAILIGGALFTLSMGQLDQWVGIAIAFAVLHFFLFCNVLRMSRAPELIWAGVFVALALAAIEKALSWPVAFAISGALTVVLAVIESRRARYHGVGWRWLNPQLPLWWYARRSARARIFCSSRRNLNSRQSTTTSNISPAAPAGKSRDITPS